ncbi:MAG: TonB-dependent receptor [Pseudomonadales bacterium]
MQDQHLKPFVRTGISLAISAAFTTAVPTTVYAQDSVLEEIIVTARKRSQSIQDVPMHIQAFGQKDIREKMLRGFEDYMTELTSVSFGTSSPGATTIAFRGALAQPSGFDTISSSILYLDEVPITRDGQNPDVRLIDVERLEALSGPQPTLYGAGSQSGTLKIVTNKPNTEEFGGWVDASVGHTSEGEESYNTAIALNIPLIDNKLAVRLVGFYEYEGGYIDNVLGTTGDYSADNGDRSNADMVEDDINDYTNFGARAMLRYQPNDDWTIDFGVVYQNSELDSLFDFNPEFGDLNTIKFKDEKDNDEWYNVSLTVQGDVGFADLTIASGYHDRKIDYDLDATAYMTAYKENGLGIAEYYTGIRAFLDYDTCYATAYCYLFVNYNDFGPDPTATISLDQRVRSFVQEIRLTSKGDDDSRFNWLIGAFYEKTDNDWDYITVVDDFAENGGGGSIFSYYGVAPTDVWFDQGFRGDLDYNGLAGNSFNGQRQDIESTAVFGEASFDVTDTLTISAGGRWFSTDRRVAENSLFVDQVSDNFDVTETTEDFSPRINFTWTPTDDLMAYFTYSEGVRIGGRNGGVTQQRQAATALGAPETFGPDTLINYELGMKSTWLDGRLIANLSAFLMDWEDYQIRVSLPVAGATTVNAGNASIDGFEGQFAFKPTDKLELSAAFTYLDARIDDDVVLNNGAIVAGEAGDPLPAVPDWKVTAGAVYRTPLPWGEGLTGSARFDASYTDDSVNATSASVSLFGSQSSIPRALPSYSIGNLVFTVTTQNETEFWLGVDNVWDERAITFISPRFSDDRAFTIRPRTFRFGFYKPF